MAHCQKTASRVDYYCVRLCVGQNVIATEGHRSRMCLGDLPAVGFIQCVLHCGDLFVDLKGINNVKDHCLSL